MFTQKFYILEIFPYDGAIEEWNVIYCQYAING
jgi:hypothetical protein